MKAFAFLDADLVLQGGAVKGIALTGAVLEFMKTYHFRRIAGTSAGSIVGALVAAGFTPDELTAATNKLAYDRLPRPADPGAGPQREPVPLAGADRNFGRGVVNFGISAPGREALCDRGSEAAKAFLATWQSSLPGARE
ncbi:MAG: hypothetical protein QOI25_1265 [Mycobacterium sp.]|nr:hypothetical protein [Mycobacterium sp.]MDT5325211.1 hypothetical protein [Mycobacterium sp.]